jgi:F-box protein 7
MPKEQGTLAQVLSVQEQVIGREESETSRQELPLNFPNQKTTSRHESFVSAGFKGVAEPFSSKQTTKKAPSTLNFNTSPRLNLSAKKLKI